MDLTQEKHKTRCLWLENYRIYFLIFIQFVLQYTSFASELFNQTHINTKINRVQTPTRHKTPLYTNTDF